LGIGDWGLGIWGLGPSPKPQTPNPKTQNPLNLFIIIIKKFNKKIKFFKNKKNFKK